MVDQLQLSDFLESHPVPLVAGFQSLITSKKEYIELSSDPKEKLKPGQFFKHQTLTHRYLRNYDELLIASETGTGKSGEVIGFFENVRREIRKAKTDPEGADSKLSHFKRIVCLFKNSVQEDEFKNQLVCKFSNNEFIPESIHTLSNETTQKSAITKAINKSEYEIYTYRTFARGIEEKYKNNYQGLANDYSNTIFWIDEAHNLTIEDKALYDEKRITYNTIWTVLHAGNRTKRIITTATPMTNEPEDLCSIMNLILPENGILPKNFNRKLVTDNDIRVLFPRLLTRLNFESIDTEELGKYFVGQFPDDYSFKDKKLSDVEPYFRGRVTYVRYSTPNVIIQEQTNPKTQHVNAIYNSINVGGVVGTKTQLYISEMSPFHSKIYLNAIKDRRNLSLLTGVKQASNFVFPDGQYGGGLSDEERAARKRNKNRLDQPEQLMIQGESIITEERDYGKAFHKYVKVENGTFSASKELTKELSSYETLKRLSCKYAEIVELSINAKGNVFIYTDEVDAGAILIALSLESRGYKRYDQPESIFTSLDQNKTKNYCATNQDTNRVVKSNVLKQNRYAILTGDFKSDFRNIMETMNSYENRNGDYIKILIVSRIGRETISVNNILNIHIAVGQWNQSALEQARARAIRATSFVDLIAEEIKNNPNKNPNDIKIKVNVYNHAAVSPELETPNTIMNNVDIKLYIDSERKDRDIKRIMRMMKQTSVTCHIHKTRNVVQSDIDYSKECDYDLCNYECVDPYIESSIDYGTYDILYSRQIVGSIMREIINMYRIENTFTLDDIMDELDRREFVTDEKYVVFALEQIIYKHITILNRFGYRTYLQEDNGLFFLSKDYPTGNDTSYEMSYYTSELNCTEIKELINVKTITEFVIDKNAYLGLSKQELYYKLANTNIEKQVKILEMAMIDKYVNLFNDTFTNSILDNYKYLIFSIREPISELKKMYDKLNRLEKSRGRRKLESNMWKVTKLSVEKLQSGTIDFTYDTDTEIVYLHTLYSKEEGVTKYNVMATINNANTNIRLLKPSEGKMRDLSLNEFHVYNAFIQISISRRNNEFSKNKIYGIVINNDFRIVDTRNIDLTSIRSGRDINSGIEATSMKTNDLVDVMYYLEIPITQNDIQYNPTNTKFKKYRKIIESMVLRKDDLSKYIKDKLDSENLIMYI